MATYIPQKAEDSASADGDLGVPILGIRNEDDTTKIGSEDDYGMIALDDAGHPLVAGTIAHDSPDATAPVKIGGKARTANPTAVANDDRVDATFDDIGRQVVVANQVRDLVTDTYVTLSGTAADTALFTAGGAGVFLDLTAVIAVNTSASAVRVDFRDHTVGDGGAVRFSLYLPAGDTRGFVLQVPRPQTTANKTWAVQCSVGVTDVRIWAQAVKNV